MIASSAVSVLSVRFARQWANIYHVKVGGRMCGSIRATHTEPFSANDLWSWRVNATIAGRRVGGEGSGTLTQCKVEVRRLLTPGSVA